MGGSLRSPATCAGTRCASARIGHHATDVVKACQDTFLMHRGLLWEHEHQSAVEHRAAIMSFSKGMHAGSISSALQVHAELMINQSIVQPTLYVL